MALQIDPEKSVLFLLDFQNVILGRLDDATQVISRAEKAVATCRQKGMAVAHCRVAFDEQDKASIPATNFSFAGLRNDAQRLSALDVDAPTAQFIEMLAPREGDMVFRKTRYGPMMCGPSAAMHEEFKKRRIDTMIIGGVVTSGAVLSTVRQAADLDYRILVLEDCCQDHDPELHRVLMQKVFPKQGHVLQSDEIEHACVERN